MKYVRWLPGFTDGTTFNIPSIGQAEVQDFAEGQKVVYSSMPTGNFTFTINKYKSSATFITEQMLQDSFWKSELVSGFVPKQHRALMKSLEVDILAKGPASQTASNANAINSADHRWVGGGLNETMAPEDFAKALNSLDMADVPLTNLVAIVHPSVAYALNTMTNIVNVSNNPQWEGIIANGMTTGMRFVKNIYGFDVYTSKNLPVLGAETIGGRTTAATAVGNLFFSAASDVLPFVGSIRQPPKVDSEYNKDEQREEYVTTCRWGVKSYHAENTVVVLTDVDQVGA
jgi:hypothetical protein